MEIIICWIMYVFQLWSGEERSGVGDNGPKRIKKK